MIKKMCRLDIMVEAVCHHPDDSSRVYTFGIEYDNYNPLVDSEECEQFKKQLREVIQHEVNPTGYWHDVEIYLVWYFDNKKYREEVA